MHEYTQGFVEYFDLSMPLELPKADWVLSLEVGEHVPSNYEQAMLIRNLHHHNRKGVILSWSVIGQGGHSHVNNHLLSSGITVTQFHAFLLTSALFYPKINKHYLGYSFGILSKCHWHHYYANLSPLLLLINFRSRYDIIKLTQQTQDHPLYTTLIRHLLP